MILIKDNEKLEERYQWNSSSSFYQCLCWTWKFDVSVPCQGAAGQHTYLHLIYVIYVNHLNLFMHEIFLKYHAHN